MDDMLTSKPWAGRQPPSLAVPHILIQLNAEQKPLN